MARRTCASSPGRLPAVSISIAFRYRDRSSNCWYRGSAPGTFCPWRGRAHFLRWAPIMGILRYPDDLKVSGMLEIIAEVFSDRVAVFEIFLLKEAVDDSDVARGWRVLFILGTAFDLHSGSPAKVHTEKPGAWFDLFWSATQGRELRGGGGHSTGKLRRAAQAGDRPMGQCRPPEGLDRR